MCSCLSVIKGDKGEAPLIEVLHRLHFTEVAEQLPKQIRGLGCGRYPGDEYPVVIVPLHFTCGSDLLSAPVHRACGPSRLELANLRIDEAKDHATKKKDHDQSMHVHGTCSGPRLLLREHSCLGANFRRRSFGGFSPINLPDGGVLRPSSTNALLCAAAFSFPGRSSG